MSKKTLKQALIVMGLTALGLVLFSALPVHAALINTGDVPQNITSATGGNGSFRDLLLKILNFFLGFLGLVAVIMIIYGGFMYVSATGDTSKAQKAQKIITYAIIGIVIILLSFAIVYTVLGGAAQGGDTTGG